MHPNIMAYLIMAPVQMVGPSLYRHYLQDRFLGCTPPVLCQECIPDSRSETLVRDGGPCTIRRPLCPPTDP